MEKSLSLYKINYNHVPLQDGMCHHRGFSRRHTPDRLVPAAREAVLASDGVPVKHPRLYGLLVSIQQKQSKQHTYPTALCETHIGGHR